MALPLTPLQPVTKATFGEESGDMFGVIVLFDDVDARGDVPQVLR